MIAPSPRSHVSKLGLSATLVMDLYRGRVRTVGALCRQTETTLLRVQNIGPAAVGRIRATLAKHGLALAGEGPPHDLTPAEVGRARVLAAYQAWTSSSEPGDALMRDVGAVLWRAQLISTAGGLTADGSALLDRARKAGVL